MLTKIQLFLEDGGGEDGEQDDVGWDVEVKIAEAVDQDCNNSAHSAQG